MDWSENWIREINRGMVMKMTKKCNNPVCGHEFTSHDNGYKCRKSLKGHGRGRKRCTCNKFEALCCKCKKPIIRKNKRERTGNICRNCFEDPKTKHKGQLSHVYKRKNEKTGNKNN